jgi:hypothetical protein
MKIRPEILDHWPEVSAYFPAGFNLEATARSRGAFTRAREIKNAETLLRLALAYGGLGMSLRETCAWAEAGGIVVSLSDPSLLERLCKAAPWLGDIVAALVAEQAKVPAGRWAGYRLRALDGTSICEPGADRTTWRLHVGYDLATGQVDQLELTDGHGAENLQRLTYRPGEIVLGDRCYARPRDLRPVLDAGADFIVRTGWNSLRLLQASGEPFDLFAALAAQAGQESERGGPAGAADAASRYPTQGPRTGGSRAEASAQGRQEARQATRSAQSRGGEVHSPADLAAGRHLPAGRHPRHLSLSLANRAGVQTIQESGRPRLAAGQET